MKRQFILRFLIDGIGRVVMMGLIIFLARVLGVSDFGKLTFALSFANIIYLLSEGGTHLIFLREMGRATSGQSVDTLQERNDIWRDFFGLKVLLSLAAAILTTLLSIKVWPWSQPIILIGVCFWMLGNSFSDFLHQVCNATDRLSASAVVMLLQRIFCLTGAAAGYFLHRDLLAVSLGLCAGSLSAAVISFVFMHRLLGLAAWPGWHFARWKGKLIESVPLAMGSFFGSTYMRLGILMLPWLGRSAESGYYGAAQKIYETGYMIPAALMSVAVPRMSRSLADHPSLLKRDFWILMKYILGMSTICLIGGQFLALPLIRGVYGNAYLPSANLFRVFSVGMALVFINFLLTHLLIVIHQAPRHAMNEAVCLAACAAFTWRFGTMYGMLGAAWSLVGTEALLFCLTLFTLWSYRTTWYVPAIQNASGT